MVDRIQLNNVKFQYNNKTILKNITYSFDDGIYMIKGGKGVGKSSLLRLIAKHSTPSNGKIQQIPGTVTEYLYQEEMIFDDLTVKENLYIKANAVHSPSDDFELIAKDAVKRFNISSLINYKVSLLSSGEKKRLQFAMLFLMNPDVILLDEPVTNPEDKNQYDVIREVERIWANKLVIIVSQYDLELRHPFTQLEIREGTLVEALQ